ncbi:hypothetical protein I4F81_003465 [Pyropia yezoensis]|uniref:Uncharacterized protein n=1 Tax=Pyropia yezoensis TaxID=2788 RepID=A0ACC3BSE9_PYRYE|nr:hypothetical protein I4F81_003465 [Neopyropia yezoensis]
MVGSIDRSSTCACALVFKNESLSNAWRIWEWCEGNMSTTSLADFSSVRPTTEAYTLHPSISSTFHSVGHLSFTARATNAAYTCQSAPSNPCFSRQCTSAPSSR